MMLDDVLLVKLSLAFFAILALFTVNKKNTSGILYHLVGLCTVGVFACNEMGVMGFILTWVAFGTPILFNYLVGDGWKTVKESFSERKGLDADFYYKFEEDDKNVTVWPLNAEAKLALSKSALKTSHRRRLGYVSGFTDLFHLMSDWHSLKFVPAENMKSPAVGECIRHFGTASQQLLVTGIRKVETTA